MKKADPPDLTGRRRLSSISSSEIHLVSASHASQAQTPLQVQQRQLALDSLKMAKDLLLALREMLNLLQSSPLADPHKTKPRKDWLCIHRQIENIKSYFISDLIGGKKEASESEKQAAVERFKEICITTDKIEVLIPSPLEGDDNANSFKRGFLRAKASADGTEVVKEEDYPIARLLERHPDTWWLEQMSHVLLRTDETRSAEEAKFSYRELYEGVLTDIIKKLCAQHPAYKQHQHNLAFSGLDNKFKELLEFTGNTFKYHSDIISYFKSLKAQARLPQFEDLDAYTYKALEELVPYIVTVEQDSVRLPKELSDIVRIIVEFVLPKLEGVLGIKIDAQNDAQEIKGLLAEIDSRLAQLPFRLYRDTLFRNKNFDPTVVLKAHPKGSKSGVMDRFMGHLGRDYVQLLVLKIMHPANIPGPMTKINQLTHNIGVMHQLLSAQIGVVNKIIGWVDHGNEYTYASTAPDENGFSRTYDKLIAIYNGVYSLPKVEDKTSQVRQRKESADKSVSPPPTNGIRVSAEGLGVNSASKTRSRSISRASGDAPGFFTGLDGATVKADNLSPRKSANNSPRAPGSASNSPRAGGSANRSPRSHVNSPTGSPRTIVPATVAAVDSADVVSSAQSVPSVVAADAIPVPVPLSGDLSRKNNSPQLRDRKSKGSLRSRLWSGKSLAEPMLSEEHNGEISGGAKPKNPLSRSSSLPQFAGGEGAFAKLFKRPEDEGDSGANNGLSNTTMK